MIASIRGRYPWAVILCRFKDTPAPAVSRRDLVNMVASSGRGGLYDYWRDVSYGAMTIDGSDVFGWFEMQWQSSEIWPLDRNRWIGEAKRLADMYGVDLSAYRGVIAVVNGPIDAGSSSEVAVPLRPVRGIRRYRHCRACGILVSTNRPNNHAVCAAAIGRLETHLLDTSGDYAVMPDPGGDHTQGGWKECVRCGALVHGGDTGWCPATGGGHSVLAPSYALLMDLPAAGGQHGWRWCSVCNHLVISGDKPCRGGKKHKINGSSTYSLIMDVSDAEGQNGWRWCSQCDALFYGTGIGACPGGNAVAPGHATGVSDYRLAHNAPFAGGQGSWKYCQTCGGLVHGAGQCIGGQHHAPASSEYHLLMDPPITGERNWRYCQTCHALVRSGSAQKCKGGQAHVLTGSSDYVVENVIHALGQFVSAEYLSVGFLAHETGHCLGLADSFGVDRTVAYGDRSDIMSWENADMRSVPKFGYAGPGLNAPTLSKLGWLPPERVLTWDASTLNLFPVVELAALTRPEARGYLMARAVLSDRIVTISFREKRGWDAALASDGVEIHTLLTHASLGHYSLRHCGECKSLIDAVTVSCPAGGVHVEGDSLTYAPLIVSDGWKWCAMCSTAVAVDGVSVCPNAIFPGGSHAPAGFSFFADPAIFDKPDSERAENGPS